MQTQFDGRRSDSLLLGCVIWGCGLVTTIVGLLIYVAIDTYDPTVSCDELWVRAFDARAANGGKAQSNLDAWDDWELLCGYDNPP